MIKTITGHMLNVVICERPGSVNNKYAEVKPLQGWDYYFDVTDRIIVDGKYYWPLLSRIIKSKSEIDAMNINTSEDRKTVTFKD